MGRPTLTPADRHHREEFSHFVRKHAHGPHRLVLKHLYRLWDDWNREYFRGRLLTPHILLAEPRSPRALGDHARLTSWGSKNQIRIRPSLYDGTHPAVSAGETFREGRARLIADVLLHETIHQYHDEITGHAERSYHGHGPAFRDECNRIGAILGLPPVRTAKARGAGKSLPSCAQWPLSVRAANFYGGACDFSHEVPAGPEGPDASGTTRRPGVVLKIAASSEELAKWLSMAMDQFERRFTITSQQKLRAIGLIEREVTQGRGGCPVSPGDEAGHRFGGGDKISLVEC